MQIRLASLTLAFTGVLSSHVALAGHGPTLSTAIEQGKVEARITGLGGSTGDTIQIVVRRKVSESLRLSIPMGTVFRSHKEGVQDMVAGGVKGERVSGDKYRRSSEIRLDDDEQHTYVVEAYCLDFSKANPTATDTFSLSKIDQRAAEIIALGKNTKVHINAIQSALWMDGESVGETSLRQRFPVNDEQFVAARRLIESHAKKAKAGEDQSISPSVTTEPGGWSVYRFRPPRSIPEGIRSRNVAVQDTVDGQQQITNLEDSRLAFFGGDYFPDAPGSVNIHVRLDPKVGHTTLAGLGFEVDCIVNIWNDGLIEVDKERVVARNSAGMKYTSRRIRVNGKSPIVMLRECANRCQLRPGETETLVLEKDGLMTFEFVISEFGKRQFRITTQSVEPVKLKMGAIVFSISKTQPLALVVEHVEDKELAPITVLNVTGEETSAFDAELAGSSP